MPFPCSNHLRALVGSVAVVTAAGSAHALEQVNLRNGFSVECAHHKVMGERVRLYTGPGDTNYQELPSAQVASIESLPDPLPLPVAHVVPAVNPNPSAAEMRELLSRAGAEHDIDVELLASVVKAESNFRVDAVSRAGARGLMQLMPGTAHDLGVQDISRADQNISGGTAYLDSLLKRYKDNLALALAAYNAGPGSVDRYRGVPPFRETRAYVARVISEFNRRKTALTATKLASR